MTSHIRHANPTFSIPLPVARNTSASAGRLVSCHGQNSSFFYELLLAWVVAKLAVQLRYDLLTIAFLATQSNETEKC
jgi:hypothetical protein